jgi:cytochrome c553
MKRLPSIRQGLIGAGLILILLGSVYLLLARNAQAAPEQPIAFNHEIMVQLGIQCLFCHSDATRSPVAGMPSVQLCMGCHSTIATSAPEIQKLAGYWERQEPIPWTRVHRLPRFVYFSHQAHMAAGLNCERCHGDVGHMSVARRVVKLDMGWCLSCHEQQANASQIKDCIVCHK